MKLYATTTSDKHGREAKKGGDNWIEIRISNGNKQTARVCVTHFPNEGITHYKLDSFMFGKWYTKGSFEEYENISDNETRQAQ